MTTGTPRVTPRTRQARLVGPSAAIDPRVNAWRSDLADADLAGVVIAPRYATGEVRQCGVSSAMIRAHPGCDAVATSELLLGEAFTVFDAVDSWVWGQCGHDRYVGWLPSAALVSVESLPTHRIIACSAPVFAAADIKSRVETLLPLNASIRAIATTGNFIAIDRGWLHLRHVAAIGSVAADPIAVAEDFIGTPYVWGGRTHAGIDCSGLTQAALLACGVACPRDSDQQRARFGSAIPVDQRRRGDLAFFPGHVGLIVDCDKLLHANAFWMATIAEPFDDVLGRVPLIGIGRPTAASSPEGISTTCRVPDPSL